MAKIDITISDDLKKLLEELATDSGQSLSSMAADCLKTGAYVEAEGRNKVEVFRKTRKSRMENERKSNDQAENNKVEVFRKTRKSRMENERKSNDQAEK